MYTCLYRPEPYCAQREYLRSSGAFEAASCPRHERNKDTKTLDSASTPLDANTLLGARAFVLR
jgi:hypothetical protein